MNGDNFSHIFEELLEESNYISQSLSKSSLRKVHIRGRRLLSINEYREKVNKACQNDSLKPQPLFGICKLPYEAASRNFLLCGVPGTGKTTLVDILSQSVLPNFVGVETCKHRALVHDHKGESIALMYGMGFTFENGLLKTLNPFHKNAVYWDVAKDFDNDLFARVFAEILIEKRDNESQPFFSDAAREIVAGVIRSFNAMEPYRWKFHHLVRACCLSPFKELVNFLKYRKDNAGIVQTLESRSEKTTDSILSTLRTEIGKFKEIAVLWSKAKEGITVSDFLSGSYVLLLGSFSLAEEAVETVNRLFVTRLLEALLCGENVHILDKSNPNRTWLILDEAPMLGNLKRLPKALDLGRQLGLAVVFCFHDIHQLTSVYGELTKSLLAKFQNRLIFKLGDMETAEWASQFFGIEEVLEIVPNINYSEGKMTYYDKVNEATGNRTTSQSIQFNKAKNTLILPEEFFDLPLANPENGLIGYLSTVIGQAKIGLTWNFINKYKPTAKDNSATRDFVDISNLEFPEF
ncbi:MAG: type IV secretion system DNA-binding domain-containing protein [Calothrix sp. MO_192.B10]|nr:type IV secretion system DNA-binding domain-containing protein [Calothrix sp. MO_192.B10]